MNSKRLLAWLAAALASLGSAIGVTVLSPATAAASQCSYPAKVATSTSVGLSTVTVHRNGSETVTVTVTSGAGTPGGRLTLLVDGHRLATLPLHGGLVTESLPTSAVGTHTVQAVYQGTCTYASSRGSSSYTVNGAQVLGTGGSRGHNRPGTPPLGVGPSGGVLAPTGLDDTTAFAGPLGLALIVLGVAVIAVGYRRHHG